MPDGFVVARTPQAYSKLPYLLRIPLGDTGVILKARVTWPRTSKVYRHRIGHWPTDAEVIDLVLDRSQENRSPLVFTRIRGGRPATTPYSWTARRWPPSNARAWPI